MKITLRAISNFGRKNGYEKEERMMARRVIKRLRDFKVQSPWSYQALLPEIDFRVPLNRKRVGEALGLIWEFCHEHEIAKLNFLVIRKDTGLPGAGVVGWFKNHFGSMEGYDAYCTQEAIMAGVQLNRGMITFEQEVEEEDI